MIQDYFTHQPILAAVIARTSGAVLELGCGWGSSLWLHGLCAVQNRVLVTVESNEEWIRQFLFLQSETHQIKLVRDWTNIEEYQKLWDVVLVDHGDAKIVKLL